MNDKIFKGIGVGCGIAGTLFSAVAATIGVVRTVNGAAEKETNAAIDAAVARHIGCCSSEEINNEN